MVPLSDPLLAFQERTDHLVDYPMPRPLSMAADGSHSWKYKEGQAWVHMEVYYKGIFFNFGHEVHSMHLDVANVELLIRRLNQLVIEAKKTHE